MSERLDKILSFVPDRIYIQIKYFYHFHKFADLKNPKTYNEKLQWIKLYDRNPKYIQLCDKYEVKKYVADMIGEEYIIPTLGIYNSFEEIDFKKLPNQFVIKCTHDSGSIVVCKDKNNFNYEAARQEISKCLKINYYWHSREWPYKQVKPRIIIEKYMEDSVYKELRDYKVFAFNGETKAIYISSDRQNPNVKTKSDYFDENFNHLPMTNKYPNADIPPEKPVNFEKMKEFANKLSKGMAEARVDFYEVDGKLYFGEITIFHGSGYDAFVPEKFDYLFGSWVNL